MAKRLETLNKLAQQLPKVENNTSLKTYFNSSQNLYNQAEIFQHDGDLEKAYIFYMRFAVFVTERIPKHKAYSSAEFEELRTQIRAKCATALDELATIKGELVKLYKQIEAEEERKKQLEEAKRREAEELKARLQREKEEEERAKAKKAESSDDDLLDYLDEDHSAYHNDNAPIIIDKEQDELLSKFKRLQPAINSNNSNGNPAEKSAPSSGISSLINSNNTNANNGLDVDALASATWSTDSLMEGIIYDHRNSNKKEDHGVNLSLEDFTNSILFRPPEPEQLIIEDVKIPSSDLPSENIERNNEANVQLLNEELMVQQLAMFDKQMNDTIFSGKVLPVTKPVSDQPIEFLPQSFDSSNTVVDVFAHVNNHNNGNDKRDKSPPKTVTQANGDSMVAVRPKKEIVRENKIEKLGPPPSYDSLVKIVEEKKQEQKAAATTPVPAPVKSVTPAAVKTPTVNPVTPVNPQVSPIVQNNKVTPQPVQVKDNKEQLLAAAKAKADREQLEMMLGAQKPSAPPMEDTSKGTEVFSELKNFIEESKSAPKSIPAALTVAKSDKPVSNLSNLVKDNNPSLYNFPRVEEAAMPVLPKVVENKDKKEKKPKSKDKHRTKSPKSSNDTSNSVPKEIQMQLEQQKQQIELLQQQVTEQHRLQQQYVQYYQLMQQLYGPQQHPHEHGSHDHSHSHGSNGNKSGTVTAKVVSNPVTSAPKQAPLPLPQSMPQPQSKTVSSISPSPNQSASRMQPLPPPAAKLPNTASNQLVPQHAPLAMPQNGQSSQQLQQLQQQLQQAQSPFPVIYGVPVVFRPYNLNLPTATNAVKTLGLNKQQQLQYQEQQFQNIYQTNKTGGILPNMQITAEAPIKEPAKPKQPEKVPEVIKKKPAKLIGGLRPMEVDGELFNSFMDHAEPNTSRSVETCGILCGVFDEVNEVFQVTCLMIPKQVGTSDTCATTDEEEIFDFQMKNDLLTLGWIHTHPTQSCFLSSVDLHTQCSYQSLFPEAIAVVIAPKFNPNFNIFNLTDRGLGFVQRCPRSGFHYHEESDLYNTSDHVKIRWGKKKYKVVDMRKRSYGR